jgi:large subunit ribosomal protein L13
MKTYTPKAGDIQQDWWLVDATNMTLGRLATEIARVLRGKHKPMYTPFLDTGDYVVVVNADKIAVTGKKLQQHMYYRHSGYPGGIKAISMQDMKRRHPERPLELAVKGMLPKNRLGAQLFRKLKVYGGPDHPHDGQQPKPLELGRRRRSED